MICLVEKRRLFNILEVLEKAVVCTISVPQLSLVHIEKSQENEQYIKISASNMEQFVEYEVICNEPVQGNEGFAVCPKVLKKVIQFLDEEIYLKYDKDKQTLTVGDNNNTLEIDKDDFIDGGDFVKGITPEIKTVGVFEVNNTELMKVEKVITPAASRWDMHNVLSCVSFKSDENGSRFAALDGNRLHVYKVDIKADKVNLIIPVKVFYLLNLHFKKNKITSEMPIKVEYGDELIKFTHHDSVFISKTLSGGYPSYEKLIPKNKKTVVLNRVDFLNKLKILQSVVNPRTNTSCLCIEKDCIKIKNGLEKLTDCRIPAVVKGKLINIAFNIRYLMDICKVNTSKELIIKYDTELSATVFQPVGQENITHLVMPIQID